MKGRRTPVWNSCMVLTFVFFFPATFGAKAEHSSGPDRLAEKCEPIPQRTSRSSGFLQTFELTHVEKETTFHVTLGIAPRIAKADLSVGWTLQVSCLSRLHSR
jgi:hypothetical protein